MSSKGLLINEGGLYSLPHESGCFIVLKLLCTDEFGGVHVRMYSNKFQGRPETVDESQLYLAPIHAAKGEVMGVGHYPLTMEAFRSWNVKFVQMSTVTEDELEGFDYWKDAGGGYWA